LTDSFSGTAQLSSNGEGSIFTQLVQHYNVRDASQDPFELEYFVINVVKRDTDQDIPDNVCIRVRTKATGDKNYRVPDGMSLVLVEHPSGFDYSSHEIEEDTEEPQKVEQDADKTTFYFNDLAEQKVFTICMKKTGDVSNPRPIYITVQDYYNPDAASNKEVELVPLQGASICDLCVDFCGEIDQCPSTGTEPAPSSAPSGNIPPVPKTSWEKSPKRHWNAPESIKQFQRDHNLNLEFFKFYVKERVRDMRNKGNPTKLIDFLQAGKITNEADFRDFDNFKRYDRDDLVEDLLAHLNMNLGILKQIAQLDT
jgi:hypothetical protein